MAALRSPTFWRYEPSTKEWVSVSSSRKAAVPQGGGTQSSTVSPVQTKRPRLPRKSQGCKHTRNRKVAGKYVRQPVRQKLDFISMRQAAKRANKTDQPMYLCVLRATEHLEQKKRPKSKAGAARGMTEGEKRKISKETGPVKEEGPIEVEIQKKVEEADTDVREQL